MKSSICILYIWFHKVYDYGNRSWVTYSSVSGVHRYQLEDGELIHAQFPVKGQLAFADDGEVTVAWSTGFSSRKSRQQSAFVRKSASDWDRLDGKEFLLFQQGQVDSFKFVMHLLAFLSFKRLHLLLKFVQIKLNIENFWIHFIHRVRMKPWTSLLSPRRARVYIACADLWVATIFTICTLVCCTNLFFTTRNVFSESVFKFQRKIYHFPFTFKVITV